MAHFELEVNSFHREDYYFAQLAQILVWANTTKEHRPKVEEFILKFGPPPGKKSGKLTAKQKLEHIERSKMFWSGLMAVAMKAKEQNKKKGVKHGRPDVPSRESGREAVRRHLKSGHGD